MYFDKRKIVIVGTGMVGMSYAYAMLNQGICNELVLIDVNRERAIGEEMDLNHGMAFAPSNMKIYAGNYDDCEDADIVVICAGAAQREGESRLDLLQKNANIFKSIVKPCVESGFKGIFIVATNPVDIMTRIVYDLSGFPPSMIIGSGTTLDTARLRYLLGEYFKVDSRNVHAYVVGEHGDSEFVPWSQAMIATKPVLKICEESRFGCSIEELKKISVDVRDSAQTIIKAKRATYYGIGMALVRITRAILGDENSVLTVSSRLSGEYGLSNVFLGLPCFVNRKGVKRILSLDLTDEEKQALAKSAETLNEFYSKIKLSD